MSTGLLEFYRTGPYAPYLREHRLAGSSNVRMLSLDQPRGDFSDPPLDDLIFGVSLHASTRMTLDQGAGTWRGRCLRDDCFATTPGIRTTILCDDPQACLVVAVPRASLPALFGEDGPAALGDLGRLHAGPFRDRLVADLCRRMWAEAADGSPLGSLFADGALIAVATALRRSAQVKPSEAGNALRARSLGRVLDHIEAVLHDGEGELTLDALAAAAAASRFHFARAFKAATGASPHAYVLARRVARAQDLLTGTNQSITEVALACGFASPQHMATAFRRVVGVSPTAWRRGRSR